MYERRLEGKPGPWTTNPILASYRFTNVFRAADRVSQYLISEIQYRPHRSQAPAEVFFRTLLFKLFNKIDTWEAIERELGSISYQSADFNELDRVLERASQTRPIYSAAYIMPPPKLGHARKHTNHLSLLRMMMEDGLPAKVERARSLQGVYDLLAPYPGLGPFLAFQFTIDLNYSSIVEFEEDEFVVAGPGALDGIAKCFQGVGKRSAAEIIFEMVDVQEREFQQRDLKFGGLFGRRLKPIDCQNLFCEISKYARVAHPEVPGKANRTRIKQTYRADRAPLPSPVFPPRWALIPPPASQLTRPAFEQLQLWG